MGLDKVLCARGAWDGLGPKMATNIIQYPMGHDNGTRNIFHLYPFISIIHIFSLQKTHTQSRADTGGGSNPAAVGAPGVGRKWFGGAERWVVGPVGPVDPWHHGTLELGSQLPLGLGFQEKLAEELTRWGICSDSFGENMGKLVPTTRLVKASNFI